jgi:hypothetical protein
MIVVFGEWGGIKIIKSKMTDLSNNNHDDESTSSNSSSSSESYYTNYDDDNDDESTSSNSSSSSESSSSSSSESSSSSSSESSSSSSTCYDSLRLKIIFCGDEGTDRALDLSEIIDEFDFILMNWIDFETMSNPYINDFSDEDDAIFTDEYREEEETMFKDNITKCFHTANYRIASGEFDDPKYHKDMSKLFELLFVDFDYMWDLEDGFGFDDSWYSCDEIQIVSSNLKKLIQLYIEEIVRPYHINMIHETASVLKSETLISDDNICDILSYLTDESIITKHEVDTFVYTAGV